jgi:tetratricopeptide (TPR) repeat protein
VVFILTSCHWHEAKEVIATADSLDQTEHLIYDDTAALGKSIRYLDNPFGRVLMSNTLGKAYYYMGRNFSFSDRIAEAAECYIEADRLQIDDPIYRGRVNSCMGYICAQNNNDSLALIFYERANKAFKESANEWYYAQNLLNIGRCYLEQHLFYQADSILHIAKNYQLDSTYTARRIKTTGLNFYEQQKYDSALVYFKQEVDY